jgi:SAM-dependent methyltransferase
MDEATKEQLLELNRRFYARHARSFSDSRRRPWSGWERVVEHVGSFGSEVLRVLDVGCGNGRFGAYLEQQARGRVQYHGIDSCPELLAEAERRLPLAPDGPFKAILEETDVIRDGLSRTLGTHRYHLIAVFGLLHHLPGRSNRSELLASLGLHLEPEGLLAVSLWRFDRRPRYREMVVPWSSDRDCPIDPAKLEAGDHLLTWAGDRETPRYCHLVDDEEVTELVESSSLRLMDRFAADGAGADNCYLIFGRG